MTKKMVPCGYCRTAGRVGSGYGNYATTVCPVCLGRKQISIDADAKKCQGCDGTGRQYTGHFTLGLVKHESCRGTGWITPRAKQVACSIACHK